MASREQLDLIRHARSGLPWAQLELGKCYLAGSVGLPKSVPAALHWLDRAAQQGCPEASALIDSAAPAPDPQQDLALGLQHARMASSGQRLPAGSGSANFKRAIGALLQAGEQGLAEAWFALSRIYAKSEFSGRNVADAQHYLRIAADMGYRAAQLECGKHAWRARRLQLDNDVLALYWWTQAAMQGCPQARAALRKHAPRSAVPQAEAQAAAAAARSLRSRYPLLAARLELAALFGLNRAEALLIDIRQADRGHCLVIDIRASYGRSRRHLLPIEGRAERAALDRLAAVFEGIDCGPCGPEGNYRQRLYRLRTLIPALGADGAFEACAGVGTRAVTR